MNIINVDLPDRSYPIYIGTELLGNTRLYEPHIHGSKVLVVTNSTIEPLYAPTVVDAIRPLGQVDTFVLPDGEIHKNLNTINRIFDHMIETMCDRTTTVIALGGGVVGDITGFAAACYQRGVPFIQIPTTLLAQVDSSVGGKTGVNHERGKNMIGAFYQPQCVLADTNALQTLPDREFKAGLAEVLKYGAIRDAAFFTWLEAEIESLLNRNPESLAHAIERSCQIKSEVVLEDERESGIRAILNFGHTFGHAIETWLGYESWLHGEAVAAGMVLASDFSAELEWLNQSDSTRIKQLIADAGLPTRPPDGMCTEDFLELMKLDKKVRDGKVRLILLRTIGDAMICDDYPQAVLGKVLDESTAG
ncbi:MAG: 3-dehydroquinate synthase [Acidiferrobacterales bacterium]|nr:3-dehydroquinate synthase [Acidiferrobacterales bacterium]